MNAPTITFLSVEKPFMYIWMKYIKSINLSQHCAKSFIGPYSKLFPDPRQRVYPVLPLTESEAKFYYICGVSKPYNWNKNFHLAFMYSPGQSIWIKEQGIHIRIDNALRIEIEKLDKYSHPKGADPEFNTCRNWQFAYQIKNDL